MKTKNDRIQRDIVLLTLSMFIIVAAWVGFNVYHSRVSSTIDDVLQTQIVPIPGTFDNATIQQLKSRTVVHPDFLHPVSSAAAQEIIPSETPSENVDIIEPPASEAFSFPLSADTQPITQSDTPPTEPTPEGGTP